MTHSGDRVTLVEGPLGDVGGLPARSELIARYAAASDRDLSAIRWYEVLACVKLGILLEGTYARSCAGRPEPEIGRRLGDGAVSLLGRAGDLITAF